MRKWTKKIGCFAMAAAMFLSVDLGGLSIQNVQAAGTYTVSGHSREAIQKCLDEAKNAGGGTVVLPKNTYYLDNEPLHIYSDTTLKLQDGAYVRRATGCSAIMIMNGDWNSSKGLYTNSKNIVIEGGTWDGSNGSSSADTNDNMEFGHAEGITIKNTTIKNCYGEHLVEFTGVKDATVENVTFDGFIGDKNAKVNRYKEALQFDYTSKITSEAFPPYDNTPCINAKVTGCTFKNYPGGVGSHSATSGIYHTNMSFASNTFENIDNVCIDLQNYKLATVNDNLWQGSKTPQTFITFGNSTGSTSGNLINGAGDYAIFVEKGSVVTLSGDKIKNAKESGIFAKAQSDVTIRNEEISNCKKCGIYAENSAVVISKSTVNSSGDTGIYVKNPTYKVDISDNAVDTAPSAGIRVDAGIKNMKISNNTVINTKTNKDLGFGIWILGTAGGEIINNEISQFSAYGIYVRESEKGLRSSKVVVKGNKVSNGPSGIVLRNTDGATVTGNTVSSTSDFCIYINENCHNTKISNNKYSGQIGVFDKTADTSGNAETKAEVKKLNGKWVYASGDDIVTNYTGLAQYGGSWWYISKGYLDFGYTGLCKYNGTWWYVKSGKVNFGYTGLCKYNGTWWYINSGRVNFSATGLCKYNGTWWYVSGGRVNFSKTTLVQYNGTWWYVSGGYVRFGATGLCNYGGRWWYVQNGRVNFNAVTVVKYGGTWWYVNGGYVRFSAQGLCKYAGKWWYIKDGRINFSYKGLVKYNGKWWYVRGGQIDWSYSGTTTYNGGTYYVKNGMLA